MKRVTLILIVLLLLSSCSPKLQDTANLWQKALNDGKIDTALSYLADNATVTIQPPADSDGIYNGHAEIRGWYETIVAAKGSGELRDCKVDGNTLTCISTYADDGLKSIGVDFIEGSWVADIHGGKIQSYTFTMSPESLAKFPAPEPVETLAGSRTDLLGVWWFPKAGVKIEINADGTYRVASGSETIDEGEYSFNSGKITWLTSTLYCMDNPTATYEAYLTMQGETPAMLRLQVVGSDACGGRTETADGTGKFQGPSPSGTVIEPTLATEVRLTNPEAVAGKWVTRSGGYEVWHEFRPDSTMTVSVTDVGEISTSPYRFENDLMTFEDVAGNCPGIIGKYEVYGIYDGDQLVKLRFVLVGEDACEDRRKTLNGKFLTRK